MLLVLIIFSGFANASEGESNDSVHEDASSNYNHLFEVAKSEEPGIITTRGVLPEMTTDAEKKEWADLLIKSFGVIPEGDFPEIEQYSAKYGGPMESLGISVNGYITVGFDNDSPEKANESTINEIYQVIKEHYEKKGIKDVPVLFEWQGDIVAVEGDTNSLSDEETGDNNTTMQSPGFTSIMLILGLLLVAKTKR